MGANAFSMTAQDYPVTSGRRERSSSSPSVLCGHPRPCNTTPGTVTTSPTLLKRTGTGRRHTRHCTSYGLPLTPPSSRPAGGGRTANLYTTTLEAAPVRAQDSPRRPNRSEIRQDGRQLHDIARYAFTRRRIVWHACKLLSPWPIKGGAIPPSAAEGHTKMNDTLTRLSPLPRYWHLPQSIHLGPGGPDSSASLVAPLYKHHGAMQYSARAHPYWTYGPGRNQDKPCVT
jgi:hypothetical protein